MRLPRTRMKLLMENVTFLNHVTCYGISHLCALLVQYAQTSADATNSVRDAQAVSLPAQTDIFKWIGCRTMTGLILVKYAFFVQSLHNIFSHEK